MAVVALAAGCISSVGWADDTAAADKKFVAAASEGSLAEINYAKLALQKSKDKNVRAFAEKMIHDHEMLIVEMKPFAKKLDVTVSSPKLSDDSKYMELKTMSGTSFDRSYVEAMVKDHHEDLKQFMDEEAATQNPELKAAVAKGEKVILEHTEMIDNIAHMGGIQTPPMPSGL